MKHNYYIEWWTLGDTDNTPEPGTFSLMPSNLKYFLKRFINGKESKRSIVFLQDLSDNKRILINKSSLSADAR